MKKIFLGFLLIIIPAFVFGEPYLITENHPLKPKLDLLFTRARITLNKATVTSAGFTIIAHHPVSNCIVAKHFTMKGYIFKLFTDDAQNRAQLEARAFGAWSLQQAIDQFGYSHLCKVPSKWIYPLPGDEYNCILIEEEMDVVRESTTKALWKSRKVTAELLSALYHLVTDQGLSDSIRYFNVPFCRDGRISFIDTERNHIYPVHTDRFLEDLSPKGQVIWKELIHGS